MKKLDGERGAALITALMMLTILMLLGFASLILSNIDIKIAGNERESIASQYAAEAGLAAATAFLNSTTGQLELGPTGTAGIPTNEGTYGPGFQPEYPNWTQGLSGSIAGTLYNYSATISFKKNPGGGGYPSATSYPVCAFDETFNYPDSPPADEGYPVLVIDATAFGPNHASCKIEEEVTKYEIPIGKAIKGAITANSGVQIYGDMKISGLTYDENGTPVAEPPLPGIDAQGTSTLQGTPTANGSSGTFSNTTSVPADNNSANFLATLPAAFGMQNVDATIYDDPLYGWVTPDLATILKTSTVYSGGVAPTSGALAGGGIFYIQENYGSAANAVGGPNLSGNGLLLVHNPNYVPEAWRVSDPTNTAYYNPHSQYYDARLDSSSPLYTTDAYWHTNDVNGYPASGTGPKGLPGAAPENLGNITGGNFKGVIIADQINSLAGSVNIYGDVISLGALNVTSQFGSGTGHIYYSPDAISKYVTGKASINKRLSWEKKAAYSH